MQYNEQLVIGGKSMIKLNGYAAEVIKEIVCEGESIFEINRVFYSAKGSSHSMLFSRFSV
jgi:hypothetical protein